MTEILKVSKINEVYIQLHANPSVINHARDYFTYFVISAKYDLRYINKMWDGKVRLLKPNNLLYYGLLDDVIRFTQEFGYDIEITEEIRNDNITNLNDEDIDKWIAGLNLRGKNNTKITSFSYQVAGFKHAITRSRCVLECPTGSGKSLMIYKFCRKFLEDNYKILLVVPRKSLVEQLFKDFQTYSHYNKWDTDKYVQRLYGGLDKNFHKDILITTWQSIRTNHPEFFKQFDVVIGDEAHHFTAKSLIKIMESLSNAKYRIGTTGTADTEMGLDSKIKVNKFTLEGLFGKIKVLANTSDLINSGHLSKMDIKCLMLKHDIIAREYIYSLPHKNGYINEIDYIVTNTKRNEFITNVALKLTGNTLIMYRFVGKQGNFLFDNLKEKNKDKAVFYINGKTSVEYREEIIEYANTHNDTIIVASYGTFSTGINIPSVENIILAHPIKSPTSLKQTIGRGLRKSDGKSKCLLIDIADDMVYKSNRNYSFIHAMERYKIYTKEKLSFKKIEIDI